MVLNDAEIALLIEVLNEVKPYLSDIDKVESIVSKESRSVGTMIEFISRLQNEHDRASDSLLQTDLRIYTGRLKKRIRV